jgi:hypothetical protein
MTLLALLALAPAVVLWGCDNDTDNEVSGPGGGNPPATDLTCQGCHTDRDALQAALGEVSGSQVAVPIAKDG